MDRAQAKLQFIFGCGIIVVIVLITILASVPPISRDALIHHLAVPKIYIQHGGVIEIPSMDFSYYPMNLDLLYLIPVYLNKPIFAKYVHFVFALLTAWLIFQYLKRHLSTTYGLLGALFFLTIPVIVKLSVTVYVDLGLIFFSWGSIYYILKWFDNGFDTRFLVIAAIFCGLALGTKYNGLIVLLILSPMTALLYSIVQNKKIPKERIRQRNFNSIRGMGWGLVFFVVAMIVFSPWMIRNALWTQNPVYPLFEGTFNPKPIDEVIGLKEEKRPPINAFWTRRYVYKESFFQTITIPLRAFFQGKDDDPKYFDGKLNPALLFLSLASSIVFRRKRENEDFIMHRNTLAWFAVLFILFVLFKVDFRIRYMSPAIPPLVVLSVFGIKKIIDKIDIMKQPFSRFGWVSVFLIMLSMFAYNVKYFVDQFDYIKPMEYLSGKVDRDTYISRYRIEHPIVRYANKVLPSDANVLCLSTGKRTFYLERNAHLASDFYQRRGEGYTEKLIIDRLIRFGTTYILINKSHHLNFLKQLPPNEMALFERVFNQYTRVLKEKNGVQLLKIVA